MKLSETDEPTYWERYQSECRAFRKACLSAHKRSPVVARQKPTSTDVDRNLLIDYFSIPARAAERK